MNMWQLFLDNTGRPIHKSGHYFTAYERHFGKYFNKPVSFLEIGAGNGGSGQMWKRVLGPMARIVSIDINPECATFADEQINIRIGDQSDSAFLQSLIDEFGIFDAVLDDGSHVMSHVNASFDFLYPRIALNGVYMIEDMHTAYWPNYGGGVGSADSIVERCKHFIDELNAVNIPDNGVPQTEITRHTFAITAYDSILVFEKTPFINRGMQLLGDLEKRII